MPRADDAEEMEPYNADEIARLLTAARERRNGVRWSLAFLGLRQGEALALRWADLDLDPDELRIRHTLTWLPWQHGCVPDEADPACGQRAASCRAATAVARTSARPNPRRAGAPSPSLHPW